MTDELLFKIHYERRKLLSSLLFMFFVFGNVIYAQNQNVSGIVSDQIGPMPGLTVFFSVTVYGITTYFDVKYTLANVAPNATLEFSYIGFSSQHIKVDGRSTINVTLAQDTQQLDEVVVVGYGTQRREAVTGSVASIKAEAIQEVPAPNISQALQGRIAGVEMTQTSSKPGASMQIRIRGTRSLNASNDPLIVLNGIPFAGSI